MFRRIVLWRIPTSLTHRVNPRGRKNIKKCQSRVMAQHMHISREQHQQVQGERRMIHLSAGAGVETTFNEQKRVFLPNERRDDLDGFLASEIRQIDQKEERLVGCCVITVCVYPILYWQHFRICAPNKK